MDLWIGLGVIAGVTLYIISVYNGLVNTKNQLENAWSQIDVQLQRRYDLIPNLVETAKRFMTHEQSTLLQVVQARDSARRAAGSVSEDPTSTRALAQLVKSESLLGQSLLNFNALTENYPEIRADKLMTELNDELISTENRIGFARQAFNDAVMSYNIKVQSFPNNLLAPTFGFKSADHWEVDSIETRRAVRVSFG